MLDHHQLPGQARRRAHLQVTVAASTLLGVDDQPGELGGHGPIPAEVARGIAADATWTRLLTDPASGPARPDGEPRAEFDRRREAKR